MEIIKVGGKDIPILFDMGAMELGVTVFGSMDELHAAMEHREGRNVFSDIVRLILVLGNNALDAKGEPQTLEAGWIRHNLHIKDLGTYGAVIAKEIAEGYRREIQSEAEEGPQDGYLMEDEQKNA